jgi:hypothetical protein
VNRWSARRDVLGNPILEPNANLVFSRSTVALQPRYHLIDRIAVSWACLCDAQFGMRRRQRRLSRGKRLLEKFFSWPQAGERNPDAVGIGA